MSIIESAGSGTHRSWRRALTARCAGLVGHLVEEMSNPSAHELWVGAQEGVDYDG